MIEEKISKILYENVDAYSPDVVTQLSQLFKTEMLSIIGEDEEIGTDAEYWDDARNDFRASLRSTLEERVLGRGGAK